MVAQTMLNLISPFCDKNASRLLRTSGFNLKVLKINLTAFCILFLQFPYEHIYGKWNIAENFNAVLWIITRTEQCKFCMQIASLKLNFYHQAADSVGLHVITWKK